MRSDLDDLEQVTVSLKEQALEKHRQNLAESQRIASEIEQIDTLRSEAQNDDDGLLARRAVGADTLWQSWLMRRRADLLRDAAMARAYEGESLARARIAFSRAEATQSLVQEEKAKRKYKTLQRYADQLDELGTLRHPED
ncbi:MAG: hypothetical protein ACRBB0_02975 [Pelagimonas sp.]|uniref:hypothetical protein n=1 Tax=Pelagimonas sp. TaxID=2073170 RepID=UPI003D6A1059